MATRVAVSNARVSTPEKAREQGVFRAVERGEADGTLMPWEFLKSAHSDWLRDNKIAIVTRYVRRPIAERPDVRSVYGLAETTEQANVLKVHHNRAFLQGAIGDTEIELTLETKGADHVEALTRALAGKGYAVVRR